MGPKTRMFVAYDKDSTIAIHFTMTMMLMGSFAANPTNSVRGTASCNLSGGKRGLYRLERFIGAMGVGNNT